MHSLLLRSVQLHKSRLHCMLPMLLFFTNASKSCKHCKWNIWEFLNIRLLKKGFFPGDEYMQQDWFFVCDSQMSVTQPELWWWEMRFPCTAHAWSVAFISRGACLYLPFLFCPILWWKCQSPSPQDPQGCGQCLGCLAHISNPFHHTA